MLVKIEIKKEKKHQRQLIKTRKVPVRIQTASFKFMCSLFIEPEITLPANSMQTPKQIMQSQKKEQLKLTKPTSTLKRKYKKFVTILE